MARSFRQRVTASYKAFREEFMTTDKPLDPLSEFVSWDARRTRYAILWAFYQNNAYRDIHAWSTLYRTKYGLYKYVRHIYNPTKRLADFWKTHLLGGELAISEEKNAFNTLPIILGDNAKKDLFDSISQLWLDSNWRLKRTLLPLFGVVMGDVGIRIVDDTVRGKVYMQTIHPSTVKDVDLDDLGNVKGYEIVEERQDPDKEDRTVIYRETAEREGDLVVYRTYKDDELYYWGDASDGKPEWSEDYGFIPMVWLNHNDVGLDYGESELHSKRVTIHALDDLASIIVDHSRKAMQSPKLFAGIKGKAAITPVYSDSYTDRPQPGREEMIALYTSNAQAKALSLLEPLDYMGISKVIADINVELEKDFPELRADHVAEEGGGDKASGKALRVARQATTNKADDLLRPRYDTALVTAHKMALSIGGHRNYEGYDGINLDSFGKGELDHSIGSRPVFDSDPADELELEGKFWDNAAKAKGVGVDLPIYLKRHGWSEEDINDVVAGEAYQAILNGYSLALQDSDEFDDMDES